MCYSASLEPFKSAHCHHKLHFNPHFNCSISRLSSRMNILVIVSSEQDSLPDCFSWLYKHTLCLQHLLSGQRLERQAVVMPLLIGDRLSSLLGQSVKLFFLLTVSLYL